MIWNSDGSGEFLGREIEFYVTAARDIGKADSFGKSDPYCKLYWNGKSIGRTRTCPNTLNPLWDDDPFIAAIPGDYEVRAQSRYYLLSIIYYLLSIIYLSIGLSIYVSIYLSIYLSILVPLLILIGIYCLFLLYSSSASRLRTAYWNVWRQLVAQGSISRRPEDDRHRIGDFRGRLAFQAHAVSSRGDNWLVPSFFPSFLPFFLVRGGLRKRGYTKSDRYYWADYVLLDLDTRVHWAVTFNRLCADIQDVSFEFGRLPVAVAANLFFSLFSFQFVSLCLCLSLFSFFPLTFSWSDCAKSCGTPPNFSAGWDRD